MIWSLSRYLQLQLTSRLSLWEKHKFDKTNATPFIKEDTKYQTIFVVSFSFISQAEELR